MADTFNTTQIGATKTTSITHNTVDDSPLAHPLLSALPTASASFKGHSVIVPGNGTTTADTLYICLMSSTGTYSWKSIIAG